MKAAVLYELGKAPKYGDHADPQVQNDNQLLLTMKAASVKNLDKARASGSHYAPHKNLPEVVGMDGVGILPDGTRVYAIGMSGMIAEKALVDKNRYVKIPDGLDDITAAALPNAVMGAALALKFRAGIQEGQTVMINGATGVTGMVAVQAAKHYGAKKVIVTGRNADSLQKLRTLGADELISLAQTDETIVKTIKETHSSQPIDIVIDYTWGHPVELILSALKGGGLHGTTPHVKLVTVGSMAGENINLSSATLRSSAIEILGSGLGSFSAAELGRFNTEILPEMFQLAAAGKLKIDTISMPLSEVEMAWNSPIPAGQRLVIMM